MATDHLTVVAEILNEHRAVVLATRSGLDHARRAGELLLKLKRQFSHGAWLPFLTTHCAQLAPRTAQGYIRLFKFWDIVEAERNTRHGAHLSLHEALRLVGNGRLDEPKSARAEPVPLTDLTPDDRRELRRIEAELSAFPFIPKTWNEAGSGQGGDAAIVGGAAGALVYWDIVGGNPDVGRPSFRYSRAEVLQKLRAFLDNGRRSVISDLAVDVARRRIHGDRSLHAPALPPEAGDVVETMTFYPTALEREEFECLAGQLRLVFAEPDDWQLVLSLMRWVAEQAMRRAS
jgi:hypothetical protein